jgi:hypothetical protein
LLTAKVDEELKVADRQSDGDRLDRRWEFFQTTREAAFKSIDALLRTIILINGGAAVAILAFIGGLASQNRIQMEQLSSVANSLLIFAFGVFFAIISMALNYGTLYFTAMHAQSFKEHSLWATAKRVAEIASLVTTAISILLFICGAFAVRDAVVRLGT